MRQRQRRQSARDWINTGAAITIGSYARRYGVDKYTAYQEINSVGFPLPDSAQRWAQRPPATPRRTGRGGQGRAEQPDDDTWITLDGRLFFVAGHTPGGAPYGIFADQIAHDEPLRVP